MALSTSPVSSLVTSVSPFSVSSSQATTVTTVEDSDSQNRSPSPPALSPQEKCGEAIENRYRSILRLESHLWNAKSCQTYLARTGHVFSVLQVDSRLENNPNDKPAISRSDDEDASENTYSLIALKELKIITEKDDEIEIDRNRTLLTDNKIKIKMAAFKKHLKEAKLAAENYEEATQAYTTAAQHITSDENSALRNQILKTLGDTNMNILATFSNSITGRARLASMVEQGKSLEQNVIVERLEVLPAPKPKAKSPFCVIL